MTKLEILETQFARGGLSRREFILRSAAIGAGIAVPGLGC
jgi:hypothetical protein